MSGRRRELRGERLRPLIGVLAIVVLVAFVYVSYTANQGLPLQSTYNVTAEVPNADRLIKTDEVRIGGVRVGQVSSVGARIGAGGKPYAVLGLALSPSAGPLPADTRVEVQSASVLGQTYVDLAPGTSRAKIRDGGTLPLRDASGTIELTDLLDIFKHSTAAAIQDTIGSFGAGVAGRGPALNETLGSLARLLGPFTALSETLASPATDLSGFLHGWESFAAALSPVKTELAELVANGATTFGALDAVAGDLGAAIDASAPTETAATQALQRLRTPLNRLAALTVRLRAAGALLPGTLTQVNGTLAAGVRPLTELPAFADQLKGALTELETFSSAPATSGTLRKLTDALVAINPLLVALTPAQLDCNVIGLYGRNFGSAWGTLGSGIGPSIVAAGVVTGGATAEELQSAAPAANLHINYLPHENAHECESGNEPYSTSSKDLSNPPGNQSRTVPKTTPPAGVLSLARRAGLLNAPPGTAR
jgi:virulence factor Mce-like protein